MATRWCMSCESEFVATVEVCPDCGVDLVDRDPEERDAALDADPSGQTAYELHEWAVESRVMLEQLVEGAGVPRAWEGATLVVPAAFEARVDELVAQVQATTLATLDPDQAKIAYDVADWTDDQLTTLADALDTIGVPYEFDADGSVVVHEEDEARVDDLLESIEFPDALKPDMEGETDIDGVDVPELLGDLFIAVDRLHHHARDATGVLQLVAAAEALEGVAVPFGFAPAVWKDIVGQAERLRRVLEDDSEGDEQIEERATELRTLLRQYV